MEGSTMALEDVTVTLKKLRRQVAKGSTPELKRERELYSALLGLVDFVEELDAGLVLAGAVDIGSRLARLEGRLQNSVSLPAPPLRRNSPPPLAAPCPYRPCCEP